MYGPRNAQYIEFRNQNKILHYATFRVPSLNKSCAIVVEFD